MTQELYTRYAFISYNHKDAKWAKWLHKKLEGYKLPSEIHNEFEDSRYLRPIFRDKDDLDAGVLGDELRAKLEGSKYLIVICSPRSAKSGWVNNEVKAFIEMGRYDRIIPFIIEGLPYTNGDDECYPKALREYLEKNPGKDLLGVNINEVGRQKAYVRVVSHLLDIEFDELWKRHERERKKRIAIASVSTPIILFLLYFFCVPVEVSINVKDEIHHLPMPQSFLIHFDGKEYSLSKPDTTITVKDLPGYYRYKHLNGDVSATYYKTLKFNVQPSLGISSDVDVHLQRDSTFAIYAGNVIDENGNELKDVNVKIGDKSCKTDAQGNFKITLPVNAQTVTKEVIIEKDGYQTKQRTDEVPGDDIGYMLRRNH